MSISHYGMGYSEFGNLKKYLSTHKSTAIAVEDDAAHIFQAHLGNVFDLKTIMFFFKDRLLRALRVAIRENRTMSLLIYSKRNTDRRGKEKKFYRISVASIVGAIVVFFSSSALSYPANSTSTVPFVGCEGDSQSGPVDPQSGGPVIATMPKAVAEKLSFYGGESLGFLAPRGWICHSVTGNAFSWLWASPSAQNLTTGPIVAILNVVSETGPGIIFSSKLCAQYFPSTCDKKVWLAAAKNTWSLPSNEVLVPRFKHDLLDYISRLTLEFKTPEEQQGLGTYILSTFPFNNQDENGSNETKRLNSSGLVIIENPQGPDMSVTILIVRLPFSKDQLGESILRHQLKFSHQKHVQ